MTPSRRPAVQTTANVLERFASWIDERATFDEQRAKPFPVIHDHACAQCGGSMVRDGFVCVVHEARALRSLAGAAGHEEMMDCYQFGDTRTLGNDTRSAAPAADGGGGENQSCAGAQRPAVHDQSTDDHRVSPPSASSAAGGWDWECKPPRRHETVHTDDGKWRCVKCKRVFEDAGATMEIAEVAAPAASPPAETRPTEFQIGNTISRAIWSLGFDGNLPEEYRHSVAAAAKEIIKLFRNTQREASGTAREAPGTSRDDASSDASVGVQPVPQSAPTPSPSGGELERCPQNTVDRSLSALEAMADQWSAEVNLPEMIKNALSVARLNRNAPDDVREQFIGRAEAQVHAIVCQAFVEASYRAYCAGADSRAPLPRVEGAENLTCRARKQGTAGGNDPAECDWPACGCDLHANKVIAALMESGCWPAPFSPGARHE